VLIKSLKCARANQPNRIKISVKKNSESDIKWQSQGRRGMRLEMGDMHFFTPQRKKVAPIEAEAIENAVTG